MPDRDRDHDPRQDRHHHDRHRPFRQQRLPSVDGHGWPLTPLRPDLTGGVAEGGIDRGVDQGSAEEAAHDRQQGQVEGAQTESRSRRKGPIDHRGQYERSGLRGAGGCRGVQRRQLLGNGCGDLADGRIQHPRRQTHADASGARISQELQGLCGAGAVRLGQGDNRAGEIAGDDDGGVIAAFVHPFPGFGQGDGLQIQPAGNGLRRLQRLGHFVADIHVLRADLGTGVLVHQQHRQPMQMGRRVDDGADVDQRQQEDEQRGDDERSNPHGPHLEQIRRAHR